KLARLADHNVAASQSSAAADGLQLAAYNRRRVLAALHEHLGQQCSGGRLAVGATDADAVVKPAGHQSQQVGALDGRHTACTGSNQLRIIVHDRGSVDNQVGAFDVFGALTQCDRNIHLFPFKVDGVTRVIVRTGDIVTHSVQNLHQREHTRTADTDEMKMLFIVQK